MEILCGLVRNVTYQPARHNADTFCFNPGPSNLSVISLEAIPIVYGSDSKCIKAPWYDMSLPTVSMHQNRDKPAHDKRRRIWSRGFSPNSLRVYEGRVIKYAEDLVRQLSSRSGTPLNASKWLNFFAFDVYVSQDLVHHCLY
jgi:hypothetical protein